MTDSLNALEATVPSVGSDDIPSDEHQDAVSAVAEDYLSGLAGGPAMSDRVDQIEAVLRKQPLLGLEITDEALVLHKNRNALWGNSAAQAADPVAVRLTLAYQDYDQDVRRLRNNKQRNTTTPTLRGGQRRLAPSPDSGPASFLPLFMALKELRIGYFTPYLSTPRRFSAWACLLRGEEPLPIGDQRQLDSWRREARLVPAPGAAAGPPALPLSAMGLDGWPDDAALAAQAVVIFGAGGDAAARRGALAALRVNPYCTIALQLLTILDGGTDPRVPAGDTQSEVTDVLSKVAGTKPASPPVVAKPPTAPKARWKFWK